MTNHKISLRRDYWPRYTLLGALVLLWILLSGCATIEKVTAPEALATCAVADVVTTVHGVRTGAMHEANSTFSKSINAGHFGRFILTTVAIVALAWWLYDQYQEHDAARAVVGLSAAVYCGAAINNVGLIF